jgi:hypothetical protein
VPSTRADNRTTRSYYAILEISDLSVDDSAFDHILSVENSLGATNYTFKLQVSGTLVSFTLLKWHHVENNCSW